MQWLKECDVPAHILLKTEQASFERAQQLASLIQKIIAHIGDECAEYQKQYTLLSDEQQNDVRSWHVLIQLRMDLLHVIRAEPEELFKGLVSIAPLRKWWRVVRT